MLKYDAAHLEVSRRLRKRKAALRLPRGLRTGGSSTRTAPRAPAAAGASLGGPGQSPPVPALVKETPHGSAAQLADRHYKRASSAPKPPICPPSQDRSLAWQRLLRTTPQLTEWRLEAFQVGSPAGPQRRPFIRPATSARLSSTRQSGAAELSHTAC